MTEHAEQCALFQWADIKKKFYPELEWLHAIPNGGHRHKAVAARMKAEGVKRGVPDVFLPVPNKDYAGFYIEMKFGYNKPTQEQYRWINELRRFGYRVDVIYDWQEAARQILLYLDNMPSQEQEEPIDN